MGGSSLGPEVLAAELRPPAGASGAAGAGFDRSRRRSAPSSAASIPRARCLSSRASPARTLEPNICKRLFLRPRGAALGDARRGSISSPSPIPARRCRRRPSATVSADIFYGEPSIGGRYSVLSDFGLVPAAAMGLDLRRLLDAAQRDGALLRRRACRRRKIPGVVLGAILGLAAQAGRDKVTIIASPGIADIRRLAGAAAGGIDRQAGQGPRPGRWRAAGAARVLRRRPRFRLSAARRRERRTRRRRRWPRWSAPAIRCCASGRRPLHASARSSSAGRSRPRWPARCIGINPFDQPDVEASKVKTRELTAAYEKTGGAAGRRRRCSASAASRSSPIARNAKALAAGARRSLTAGSTAHLAPHRGPAITAALLAYIERNAAASSRRCRRSALLIRDDKRVATCLGFGPRFLHSTGQAYKGGPETGVFLQITAERRGTISPMPGAATASAWSRRRRRAAISTCWPSAAAARCASISGGRRGRAGACCRTRCARSLA